MICLNLHGQNELQFSFSCSERIESHFVSRVLLILPDGKIKRLFNGSVSNYGVLEKENYKAKGEYILSIYFEAEKYGQDSINYDFELNGNEVKTSISINFDFKERLHKRGNIFKKGEKVLNGYVLINRYYKAPKTIEISYCEENIGSEFYKGPFFNIKNNSTDTLYGEHLPGYFWGTLSYLRNDSVFMTRIGTLDYEFAYSSPLYPDSVKTATVGSFGLTKKLVPFDYRFEVMLAKEWQSTGIGIYKEHKNIVWWGGVKEYYKLECNFKNK